MNNKPNNDTFKSIANSFRNYSMTFFIVLVVGGLVFCILLLNDILNKPPDDSTYMSGDETTKFDQATIDRLNNYKISSENSSSQVIPAGRNNPFSE